MQRYVFRRGDVAAVRVGSGQVFWRFMKKGVQGNCEVEDPRDLLFIDV